MKKFLILLVLISKSYSADFVFHITQEINATELYAINFAGTSTNTNVAPLEIHGIDLASSGNVTLYSNDPVTHSGINLFIMRPVTPLRYNKQILVSIYTTMDFVSIYKNCYAIPTIPTTKLSIKVIPNDVIINFDKNYSDIISLSPDDPICKWAIEQDQRKPND